MQDRNSKKTNQLRLGLDIGGTDIKAIVIDGNGSILLRFKTPSMASVSPRAVREAILKAYLEARIHFSNIVAVGIGCAGSVDSNSGVVISSPNFNQWHEIPLSQWATTDCGIPSSVHNDANCAVVAEWYMGAGRGHSNIVLLTIGTGIGGGVIINNRIFTGTNGTAGELGHMSVDFRGERCTCGNIGCFELYCSATALTRKIPTLTTEQIFSLAESDVKCMHAVEEALLSLKIGLVSLANIFDPQCMLLGGGVSKGFASRLPEVSKWVKSNCFSSIGKGLTVQLCHLENWSGAIGAALFHHVNESA